MDPGIYKLYNKIHGTNGIHKRLLARLLVHDGKLHHLEDHGLNGAFPEGPLTEDHDKSFKKASNSHYWAIEKEESDLEESLGM